MRGTCSDGLFLSQSATSLSSKFWKQCFSGVRNANSLREGETGWNPFSHSIEPQQQEGLPSLVSTVSSLSILYKRWKEGTLSRNILKDLVLGEDPHSFFKRRPDGSFTEDYGRYANFEKTFYKEEPFFKVDERERSRTPRTTTGPPSEPRGVSDGNGRCAWVLTGGDESEQVVESS